MSTASSIKKSDETSAIEKPNTKTDTDDPANYIDPCYKFNEVEPQKNEMVLHYAPTYFLRTHSKNDNPADVQTQIWQCAFPPVEAIGPIIDRSIVATCGGSSVCFIKVDTGSVLWKFNRSSKAVASENLYALAWTTLEVVEAVSSDGEDDEADPDEGPPPKKARTRPQVEGGRSSVVAAGGGKSTVALIDVEASVCYHMFKTATTKANSIICSLLFHPKHQSWLFCGHEDGHIEVWDVSKLYRPDYTEVSCVPLLSLPSVAGDAYNLTFSHQLDILVAGNDSALLLYDADMAKIAQGKQLDVTKVHLPVPSTLGQDSNVVDSVCLLRDNLLAVKCALHCAIYLLPLGTVVKRRAKVQGEKFTYLSEMTFDDIVRLEWSKTDNYYMNMGVDPRSCSLVCGDDKGTLWMYDVHALVTGAVPSPLTGGAPLPNALPPDAKLLWPDLDDHEVTKAGKLRLDSYDIVVDKCCVSEGASHIVAVTSNNMVCVWERGEE